MSIGDKPKGDPNEAMAYQIRLRGHLSVEWMDWFSCVSILLTEDGDTLLTFPTMDQAALHGVIRKARDLGMPLISLNPLDPPTDL